jgi:DNA-binding response OmpR family regulator
MLTARADDGSAASALEAGAAEFLTKPCHPAELAAAVRRLLGGAPRQAAAPFPS